MALVSPGIEITVTDESNYVPNASGTVPFIVIATAANKTSGTGTGTASGTIPANAGNTYLINSQREFTATFGTPTFYDNTNGTAINGYELNEYGALAAYSVLGVINRAYVQRANIDLAELIGTSVRPSGAPADGTIWLDVDDTKWGIFEWNKATGGFTNKVPTVITSSDNVSGGKPKASIGSVGDYAVVATDADNPVYYKNRSNVWVLVGSTSWQTSVPAVVGTESSPTFTNGDEIEINTTSVNITGTSLTQVVADINAASITGVTAEVRDNKLAIFVTSASQSDGVSTDGVASIQAGSGDVVVDAGITSGLYAAPKVSQSAHTSVPEWKTSDTTPRPTGSVWVKTTTPNNGADFDVLVYDSDASEFEVVQAPLYENDWTANRNLDSTGGGKNISVGSFYVQYDVDEDDTVTYKLYRRNGTGSTTVTGSDTSPTFTASETFTIQTSSAGSTSLGTAQTVTLSGTTAADFVADIQTANISGVSAAVTADGAVSITSTIGGVIVLKETSGTPLADAGITTSLTNVKAGNNSDLIVSDWVAPTYTASTAAPSANPTEGTYWYHSVVDEVDIMIHDGSNWKGYQNVTNDARGFDLSNTDPNGPIVAASEPTEQSDGTALVEGDLWIDTSDLENYPVIKRYEDSAWVTVDNTDQTTEDGVLFADARFMGDGTTDVITGTIPTTKSLLTNNYLDIDAPSAALYPRGMLLFNTRRSGYTVKTFQENYFNATDYPDDSLPTEKDTWVTASGNKDDGSPYMGRKAQRQVIVEAMSSAIDTNTDIREEQRQFNLIAAPGYPELIPNMVSLNDDRRNTAFIVGDTPFRLTPDEVEDWASGANATVSGEDGLVTADPYLGVFYPMGKARDLSGSEVTVPPSHMMLRTIALSDDRSFPWLAPAGTRRGRITNANDIGYVSRTSGEFVSTGVRESVRDTLYQSNVNPLTLLPGTGLVNYGNLTRAGTSSALNRINVARLIAYIRSQLDDIAKDFIFEPNDTITRNELKGAIDQFFNDLVSKRAIFDYLVVCDETNNTPARIDRNELYVDIAIEPVKSVEFIYIPIRLKNTGEIASGNIAPSNNV